MSLKEARKRAEQEGPVTRTMSRFLREEDNKPGHHDDGYFHPSAISGCPLAAAYGMFKLYSKTGVSGGEKPDRILRIFSMGHAVHAMIQDQLFKAGLIPADEDGNPMAEVNIFVQDLGLSGHLDAIVDISGKRYVLEIKTMNSYKFDKLKEPLPEHKRQAACYVIGAEHRKISVDGVIFLYYSKDNSNVKEYMHTPTPAELAAVPKQIEKIKEFIATLEAGAMPVPPYENPNADPCRMCDHKATCHDSMFRMNISEKLGELHATKNPPEKSKKIPRKGKRSRLSSLRRKRSRPSS